MNNTSSTGSSWADERFTDILEIFSRDNGPRSFQRVREQHDPSSEADYTEDIVKDLQEGKLVIVDQSAGSDHLNAYAAERIMKRVFANQQEKFRSAMMQNNADHATPHVIVYLEEAHTLLPNAKAADNLTTIWARTAKEGSKFHIGLVLATQAPSSIMSEILSETDNWILAHLNSKKERKVICDYEDFEDFEEQIGKVSERGFVRMKTLSLAYTVPIQFQRFDLQFNAFQSD